SSIYNAGLPWELGLAEAHQTLMLNGLRSRVRIETDGKLMTGRDVLVAALLGAEEFGFATAPLVTMGCVMMRVCNLDTCPMGIATQNPELRKRFRGKPEYIVNFMHFIAQELREYMAKLGIRTVDELVGRSDLLKTKRDSAIDFTDILSHSETSEKQHFDPDDIFDFELDNTIDRRVIIKKLGSALKSGNPKSISIDVVNTDRSVGALTGAEITRIHGENVLADDTFTVKCKGSGGQSFGAFIPKGLTLELCGDSNDYFGKGLSGGKLILCPPENAGFKADENIIAGNVALYGATSGKAFISGIAGERFCVRNSGAIAVCEGVGDPGCEYMTGGRAVILGVTGKNFAAGMSGGIAYVLDEKHDLYTRLNKALVSLEALENEEDIAELKTIITEHAEATGSEKAKMILTDFERWLPSFKKVIPHDYAKIQSTVKTLEKNGVSHEQAEIEAFELIRKEA
ncbi:MAG: glutamate synthase subunit alpha, partial [Ruminococcus sp.]|nr:glutamate synthase subunit alpha [Ruminococcus sp.]